LSQKTVIKKAKTKRLNKQSKQLSILQAEEAAQDSASLAHEKDENDVEIARLARNIENTLKAAALARARQVHEQEETAEIAAETAAANAKQLIEELEEDQLRLAELRLKKGTRKAKMKAKMRQKKAMKNANANAEEDPTIDNVETTNKPVEQITDQVEDENKDSFKTVDSTATQMKAMQEELSRLVQTRDQVLEQLASAKDEKDQAQRQAKQESRLLEHMVYRREHLETRTAELESTVGAIATLRSRIENQNQTMGHAMGHANQAILRAEQGKTDAYQALMQAKGEIALLRARNALKSEPHVPREQAWQQSEAVVRSMLEHAAEYALGMKGASTGYMLYGSRAINAHIKEQGLHIETRDYDFVLVCQDNNKFAKECKTLVWKLQQLVGNAVTADASTPGYLHISVHRNRVIDLSMVTTGDGVSWNAKYGPPLLLPGARGYPAVAVMPWAQLQDRLLATTSADVALAAKCFPSDFDPRTVAAWRLEKDKRQLQRMEIADRLRQPEL